MSIVGLVNSGPLLLAMPVAAAAGALTFLSPCVLPLVPGYLSYITGMSGASVATETEDPESADPETAGAGQAGAESDAPASAGRASAAQSASAVSAPGGAGGAGSIATAVPPRPARRVVPVPTRRRAVAGALLFILGFSALFAFYGAAFGSLGSALRVHEKGLAQILGVVLVVLGLLFAGAFDRFSFAGRIVKPAARPKAGLAGAPLVGVLFGLGWTPCAGPTLGAVLTLTLTTGTAARGALLAFVYALGVGIPFLIVAFAVDRGMSIFGFARRNAKLITRIGGILLIVVGLLEATGLWSHAMIWLTAHWFRGYTAPF
jgi:cytochrome c-type biogenesis protein